MVTGSAALGALITVLAGTEPGAVLGVFLVAGTVIAGLAVQPRAAYLIIPVPALTYVVAAVLAGLIHDRAGDATVTALAVHAAQWIASGFLAAITATALAIAVTAARWPGREHPREPPPDRAGSATARSVRSTRW